MKSLLNKLNFTLQQIFGYVGIVMIIIESFAVFSRNVLKAPSPWTDETLKLLFIWSIFICSSLAFLGDELIGLDLLQEKLRGRRSFFLLKALQYILGLVFGIFCSIWGFSTVSRQFSTQEMTAVMRYPLWFINLGFLIGSILIVCFAAGKILNTVKQIRDFKA